MSVKRLLTESVLWINVHVHEHINLPHIGKLLEGKIFNNFKPENIFYFYFIKMVTIVLMLTLFSSDSTLDV